MADSNAMRAAVLTESRMLFQKIKLELLGICKTDMFSESAPDGYDIYFTDLDTYGEPARGFSMSFREEIACDISLPFSIGEIEEVVKKSQRCGIFMNPTKKTVAIRGKVHLLTDVEFSLLSALYERHGNYASRDEILREVWGGSADGGVINVYIHYLREKLESSGERIIISSRNLGYKIDEKYFEEAPV